MDSLLDNLDRLFDLSFQPTDRDILMTYHPTSAVSLELHSLSRREDLRILDFGGLPIYQAKWKQFFNDQCHLIVFMCSLVPSGDYESLTKEWNDTLKQFELVASQECFRSLPLCLLLNKKDQWLDRLTDGDYTYPPLPSTQHLTDPEAFLTAIRHQFAQRLQAVSSTDRPFYIYCSNLFNVRSSQALWRALVHIMRR